MKPVFFLPALGWAFVVFIAISLPGSRLPDSDLLKLPHFDKLVHTVLFFVLAILLAYGFFKQGKNTISGRHYFTFTLVLGIIYGMLTELLQYWLISERHGNLWDFAANIIGTVFGLLIFRSLLSERTKNLPGRLQ
jgi:VanZ family protein